MKVKEYLNLSDAVVYVKNGCIHIGDISSTFILTATEWEKMKKFIDAALLENKHD